MSEVMRADLDAIRVLAGKQRSSASTIRALDVGSCFVRVLSAFAGSEVAGVCARAEVAIEAALHEVAGRIDALAAANQIAADTLGLADDTYAARIRAVATTES